MKFRLKAFARPRAERWAVPLIAVVLAMVPSLASSQSPSPVPPTVTSRPDALWRCELPGGVYLVALRSIVSISSHEYVVDAAARVTEVTVATASNVEARFYYLETLTPSSTSPFVPAATLATLQQRAQDLASTHSPIEPVWQKVTKNYPATTHAHTVEYRLSSKANLQQLYQSLEQAWTTGKGVNVKIE